MSMVEVFYADERGMYTSEPDVLKKKSILLLLIIIVSWGLEYIWVRYDLSLDLRIAGIHCIPLFLIPAGSIWFLFSERVNLIRVCGRIGQVHWWFLSVVLPVLFASMSAIVMSMLRLITLTENANIETKALGLIVDLPLNYVLWFPLLFSTEFCWRGAFLLRNGKRLRSLGRSLVSSCLWALSLAGFIWLGYSGNDFLPLGGVLSITSLIFIGIYQSMMYRRSGSILLSAISLLCIVLVNASLFEIPITGIQPLVEALHPKTIPSVTGFFVSSCISGLTGCVLWGGGKDESPPG